MKANLRHRLLSVVLSWMSIQLLFGCAVFWSGTPTTQAGECVRIYYDGVPGDPKMTYFGRIHAMYLDNVLGHFPHLQTILSPVVKYKRGDIETCKATIYLSTYYDTAIPDDFMADFVATKKRVAWAGYNIWKLGPDALARLWGVRFNGLTRLDEINRDPLGRPGFYRFYSYKGEQFEKYGEWDLKDPKRFHAAFELTILELMDPWNAMNVISWASHNTRSLPDVPYALTKDNKWFLADSPFSYAIESDRYLIFCDLLFDILNELPRRPGGKKPAIFRVEDVHAMVPLWQFFNMVDVLKQNSVPFSMTIIPIFTDPFGIEVQDALNRFVPIARDQTFREAIKYARDAGASFFYHGITHQYGRNRNPFTGVTGSDFEFWNRVDNKPIAEDSVKFVLSRIEDGLRLLDLAGINPVAWVTPHYQASPLDYNIFAQIFTWTGGRHIYFPYQKSQSRLLPESFTIERSGIAGSRERFQYLSDLKVSYDGTQLPNGQFYPYEIFGDSYGQRIIPENIGNVQSYMNEQVFKVLTVDGMIANLKRNRVLRDVWGSYFVHPFCISAKENAGVGAFPGDVAEIERLIKATRDNGYEFVDVTTWVQENTLPKRPPTVEVFLGD